jgi:hypothetical protein
VVAYAFSLVIINRHTSLVASMDAFLASETQARRTNDMCLICFNGHEFVLLY